MFGNIPREKNMKFWVVLLARLVLSSVPATSIVEEEEEVVHDVPIVSSEVIVDDTDDNILQLNDDIVVRELQSSSPRVIADIYECDENNNPVADTTTPRPMGYDIKICVSPNTPTRNRDVFVGWFDEFTFYRNQGAAVQKIVAGREEVNEKLTLVLCIPGAEVCSFKTRLRKEFFYAKENGNITGTGKIAMQFGSLAVVQNAVRDVAGIATVSIVIPVKAHNPRGKKINKDGTTEDNWWYESPWWLRLAIILAAIILFLICCCICIALGCWAGGCCDDERIKNHRTKITNRIVNTTTRNTKPPPEKEEPEGEDPEEASPGPKKKKKMPRDSVLGPEDELWQNNQADPRDFQTNEMANSVDDDDDDDEEGPNDDDVCFDAEEHPGTVAFEAALDKVVEEYPRKKYGPPIYRAVKKQLPNRRFFVCDDEEHPDEWRQINKQELIDEIGRAFTEAKREYRKRHPPLPAIKDH